MKYYVITDDYQVIAKVDLQPTDRIATNEKYSVIDENTMQVLIDNGYPVVIPEHLQEVE